MPSPGRKLAEGEAVADWVSEADRLARMDVVAVAVAVSDNDTDVERDEEDAIQTVF